MTVKRHMNAGLILGIDPGSRRMGWALLAADGVALVRIDGGVLKMASRQALPLRLGAIHDHVRALLDQHAIEAMALEAAFVYETARTALVLGQARGVPIGLAGVNGIDVHEYQPSKVKKHVVGSGRASKHQVRQMVQMLLELDEPPPEDEADALAVAITHARVRHLSSLADPTGARPRVDLDQPPL